MTQAALVLGPGVVADEATAFRQVLSRLPGTEVIGVGTVVGPVSGPGGSDSIDATFSAVRSPEILVVPGSIGVRHQVQAGDLLDWLHTVGPAAQWIVASSTGAVVLAAAGLLDGLTATTQWLATPLLESYGVTTTNHRMVCTGHVLTCQGRVSAVDLGLELARRIGGTQLARTIADDIMTETAPVPNRRFWARLLPRPRRRVLGAQHVDIIDLERVSDES